MNEKPRIGFVVNNLTVGGVSKVLIQLCNALSQDGYSVHLIILSNDLGMEDICPLDTKVKKYVFDYDFSYDYSLLAYLNNSYFQGRTIGKAKKVIEQIKQLKLDILHFHTLPRQLMIGILAKKQIQQLQLVFTDHLFRISKEDYKWHQRQLLALAYRKLYKHYHLIAVSEAVYKYIKTYRLFNPSLKFKLLENSIELGNYKREQDIKTCPPQLIYISRMNHHKGQDTLIKAWKSLKKQDEAKLYLIGPDETNGRLTKLAENDPTIIFTGSISNVKDYLNESTIAVFPSQKEGLPIALLEMMAFELPVIVSDIPELTSIIKDGVEGLHFKLDDKNDLREKINLLLNNKELAHELGLNARKKVESICKKNDPLLFHRQFYESLIRMR